MDVSIDIETLSTQKNAVVLSIGMCLFDAHGIYDGFEVSLETSAQAELGRHIDSATREWWAKQTSDAQQAAFKGMWAPWNAIYAMSDRIAFWEEVHGPLDGFWCQGPSFDGAIIESLCEDLGVRCPVHFRLWRDVRTLIDVAGQITGEGPYVADIAFEGVPHIARDDAHHQARKVIKCAEVIKSRAVNVDWSDIEARVLAHMWPDLVEEDHQVDEAANQAIPRDWSTDADPAAIKDLLNIGKQPFYVGGTVTGRFKGTSIAEQMGHEFVTSRKNAEQINIAAGVEGCSTDTIDGTFGWDEGVDIDETAAEKDPWACRLGEMPTGGPRIRWSASSGDTRVEVEMEVDTISVVSEFQRLTRTLA